MDEVSILKVRVLILEEQMKKLQEFIESFEEYRRHSRPLIPPPAEIFGDETITWLAVGKDDDDLS